MHALLLPVRAETAPPPHSPAPVTYDLVCVLLNQDSRCNLIGVLAGSTRSRGREPEATKTTAGSFRLYQTEVLLLMFLLPHLTYALDQVAFVAETST